VEEAGNGNPRQERMLAGANLAMTSFLLVRSEDGWLR
jgi:hypothetical protein